MLVFPTDRDRFHGAKAGAAGPAVVVTWRTERPLGRDRLAGLPTEVQRGLYASCDQRSSASLAGQALEHLVDDRVLLLLGGCAEAQLRVAVRKRAVQTAVPDSTAADMAGVHVRGGLGDSAYLGAARPTPRLCLGDTRSAVRVSFTVVQPNSLVLSVADVLRAFLVLCSWHEAESVGVGRILEWACAVKRLWSLCVVRPRTDGPVVLPRRLSTHRPGADFCPAYVRSASRMFGEGHP